MTPLRKDLRAMSADGAATSVMVGVGETYLPAFVLALTASPLACGLASTVPLVVGAMAQLISPWAIDRLRSYRRWVVWCVVIQALSFIPLLLAAWTGEMPTLLVFGFLSWYWAFGMAASSVWNAWVGELVPTRLCAGYFASRSRLCQLGIVTGFVGGGILLQRNARWGGPVEIFVALFAAALVSRIVSAIFLTAQHDATPPRSESLAQSFRGLTRGADRQGGVSPILYILAIQVAVQISGPYFTPYMLCQLQFSYAKYVTLIGVAYLARVVCLPAFGRIAAQYGTSRLLWIGGLGIVPASALWIVSDRFEYLVAVQIFSGVVWAAYELAMTLVFVNAIPMARRIGILTLYNLVNAVAILVGSLGGGAILWLAGQSRDAYLLLFALSAIARVAATLVLARISRPVPLPAIASLEHAIATHLERHPADSHWSPKPEVAVPSRLATAQPRQLAAPKRSLP